MKLKNIYRSGLRFIGNYFLFGAVNVLCKTLRITFINRETVDELNRQGKNYVLAFWHGTMLLPWYLHRYGNVAALTSKSKDGDLLAKLLKQWKYTVVRGSSSQGGNIALGIMVDYAKNGQSVAVTPDGPRGPVFKMKAGAVITAKKSGLPVVLLGIGFKKKRFLNSWDKFEIPKAFSAVRAVYSDPIYIDSSFGREETSKMIEECETKLNDIQREAGNF